MNKVTGWILGGGFAVIWAMTLGFLDWRASVHASDAITAASMVNPADVEANAESIKDLEANQEKLENKIERIVDILLEE